MLAPFPRQVHAEEIGDAVAGRRHGPTPRRQHGQFEAVRSLDAHVRHAVLPRAYDGERAVQAEGQQGQQHVHRLQAQVGPDPHRARDAHAGERRRGPRQVVHAHHDVGAAQQQEDVADHEANDGRQEGGGILPSVAAREDDGQGEGRADEHQQAQAEEEGAHVRLGEVRRAERERGVLVAGHQVLVLVGLHGAVHQRPAQVEQEHRAGDGAPGHQRHQRAGQHEDRRRQQVHEIGFLDAAGEAERQPAVHRVRQAEPERGPHHEGQAGQQQRDRDDAGLEREPERVVVGGQQRHGEDAPAQDRFRIAAEVEGGAGQLGVAVKIAQPARLGPGRVDAQRGHRQQQVDDPDAEVFGAAAGKRQRQRRFRGRGG
jgi:hypothetical protein